MVVNGLKLFHQNPHACDFKGLTGLFYIRTNKIQITLIIEVNYTHLILFLIKHFYDIVFSTGNISGNEKSLLPFQVQGNEAVMERSLLPNFRA